MYALASVLFALGKVKWFSMSILALTHLCCYTMKNSKKSGINSNQQHILSLLLVIYYCILYLMPFECFFPYTLLGARQLSNSLSSALLLLHLPCVCFCFVSVCVLCASLSLSLSLSLLGYFLLLGVCFFPSLFELSNELFSSLSHFTIFIALASDDNWLHILPNVCQRGN